MLAILYNGHFYILSYVAICPRTKNQGTYAHGVRRSLSFGAMISLIYIGAMQAITKITGMHLGYY